MTTNLTGNTMFLVQAFQRGNKQAFKQLFEIFWEMTFVRANAILGDAEASKDVVQKVWISLWEKRERLQIENFEGYMCTAVRNGALKHLRDNKFDALQIHIIESLRLPLKPEIEKKHDLEATQERIEQSLQKLNPRCQEIFRMSRLEKTANEEIARRLGISKKSVENQIAIALKLLKKDLAIVSALLFLSLELL